MSATRVWIAVLALASMLVGKAAAEMTVPPPPAACRLLQVAKLDMVTGVGGEVGVPVTINGKDAVLGVDTGSMYSSISIPLVNELKLPFHDIPKGRFGFFGGVDVRYITHVNDVAIGQARGTDADFLVQPFDISDYDNDGLLGPDIMHQYDVELDFAGGKFGLFLPNQCAGDTVYWTRAPYAVVPMRIGDDWGIKVQITLDGKTFDAIIDTGASRSVLTLEAAKDLFGLDEKSPGVTSLGDLQLNGQTGSAYYHYPFKEMNFGGVSVSNPDITLISKKQLGEGPPALIGISILRQLHLYIAYKEQKLYVTPAQVVEPPAIPLPASVPSAPGQTPVSPPHPQPAKPQATAPIASATSPAKQN